VFAFARASRDGKRLLVCAANLSPVPRERYRLGLPRPGRWIEALNTDAARYGRRQRLNAESVIALSESHLDEARLRQSPASSGCLRGVWSFLA
jgi:1,4-alpha-glucan branching enzyme